MNARHPVEDHITLELLDVIGKQNNLSQRHLARHTGVALGLANSYLKRCVRKGFVKITKAPANRYLYYLTPKGFTEKARLTASYLSHSFSFYHEAGESCIRVFNLCRQNNWNKVLLCGVSDLAEVALLRAMEIDIEIIGIYDIHSQSRKMIDRPIWKTLKDTGYYDVCVITDIDTSKISYESLIKSVGKERILVPDILRLDSDLQIS